MSLKVKSQRLRGQLINRIRGKQEHLREGTPTSKDIEAWLEKWDGKCYYFKTNISLSKSHLDHKVPLARGGTNELKNLCLTHPRANGVKGTMTDKEFQKFLKLIAKWEDKGKDIMDRLVRANKVYHGRKKA